MNPTGKIRIVNEVIIYTSISDNNIICEASGRGADDTTADGIHLMQYKFCGYGFRYS